MLLKRYSSFLDERLAHVTRVLAERLTLTEGLRFWKAQSEDDDQDW